MNREDTIAIMAAILMGGNRVHYASNGDFGFKYAAKDAAKLYDAVLAEPDTPETVAEKLKLARKVGDLLKGKP